MRVMAATTANDGHFGPVLVFARSWAAAGHDVAVAAPASYAAAVTRTGLRHLPFADPAPDLVGPVMARLPSLGPRADETVVREVFGRLDAQAALPGLTDAIAAWQPDLVLRDPTELGSLAAAERAGVPHAQVAIGMQEMLRYLGATLVEPLAELSVMAGLPADHLGAALSGECIVSTVPEELDRAADPAYDETLRIVRCGQGAPTPRRPPAEVTLPLVYVTFGSVTGSIPPFAGIFGQTIDALAEEPVQVLMTVGRHVDPDTLGPLPTNARVEQWLPQDDVLARAAAVVGHGGFGTTYGALAHGVPQVVVPLFTYDQAVNARHVAGYGAARTIDGGPDAADQVAAELRALLGDPAYGGRAAEGARQVAALPPVSQSLSALGALGA